MKDQLWKNCQKEGSNDNKKYKLCDKSSMHEVVVVEPRVEGGGGSIQLFKEAGVGGASMTVS